MLQFEMWLELTVAVLVMWLEHVNNKNGREFLCYFAGRSNSASKRGVGPQLLAQSNQDERMYQAVDTDPVHVQLLFLRFNCLCSIRKKTQRNTLACIEILPFHLGLVIWPISSPSRRALTRQAFRCRPLP